MRSLRATACPRSAACPCHDARPLAVAPLGTLAAMVMAAALMTLALRSRVFPAGCAPVSRALRQPRHPPPPRAARPATGVAGWRVARVADDARCRSRFSKRPGRQTSIIAPLGCGAAAWSGASGASVSGLAASASDGAGSERISAGACAVRRRASAGAALQHQRRGLRRARSHRRRDLFRGQIGGTRLKLGRLRRQRLRPAQPASRPAPLTPPARRFRRERQPPKL